MSDNSIMFLVLLESGSVKAAYLFSPMDVICCAHYILLYIINLLIFSEQYKSCSSLLFNFLYLPVATSLFGASIFLSTLFLNTLSLCSSII
jgi:hypothetical protein